MARSSGSKLATDMLKGDAIPALSRASPRRIKEFARMRQPVPFVADDIMEIFDEPRSEEVPPLFGKMSERGR